MIQSLNFIPLIKRPTRFPDGNQQGHSSLLDHIYVNFYPPSLSGILQYQITDHLPIFLNILLPNQHDNTSHTLKFRLFDEPNRQQFSRDLSGIEWEEILSNDVDIDQNLNQNLTDDLTRRYPTPNAYSAHSVRGVAHSVRGWRIRIDIQTG